MQKIRVWVMLVLGLLLSSGVQAEVKEEENLYVYKVKHVAPDDELNLRAVPGVDGDILVTIPHNGKGIVGTGKSRQLGRTVWAEVHWAGKLGWVNAYYLLEEVHTTNYNPGQEKREETLVQMQCAGTEPFWTIEVSEKKIAVKVADAEEYEVAVDFRKQSENNTSIAVVAGRRGNALTSAFLQKVEICSDGMSDKNYPYSITAMLNGRRVVSGCCSVVGAE